MRRAVGLALLGATIAIGIVGVVIWGRSDRPQDSGAGLASPPASDGPSPTLATSGSDSAGTTSPDPIPGYANPDERPAHTRRTLEQRLAQQREQLKHGKVAFPENMSMQQGQESRVVVRVSDNSTITLAGIPGTVTVQDVEVSPIMVACLDSTPGEFRIRGGSGDVASSKPKDSDWHSCRQKTVTGAKTDWEWFVTPLVSGERNLRATVEARLVLRGRDFEGPTLDPIEQVIHVDSDLGYVISGTLKKVDWKWLLGVLGFTGLLGGFAPWLLRRLRGERGKSGGSGG